MTDDEQGAQNLLGALSYVLPELKRLFFVLLGKVCCLMVKNLYSGAAIAQVNLIGTQCLLV